MGQRSVILYTRTTPPPEEFAAEYQQVGPAWVRTLTVAGNPSDALDHAGISLRAGESVSISHPLPDVPHHHRLLVEGEAAKEGDEATNNNGTTWASLEAVKREYGWWAPLPGEAYVPAKHYPVRRRITAHTDAY